MSSWKMKKKEKVATQRKGGKKKKYKTKIRKKEEEVKGGKDKVTNPKRKTDGWRGVIHVSQNPPFLYHHPILPTQKHNSLVQPFRCALSFQSNHKKKRSKKKRALEERQICGQLVFVFPFFSFFFFFWFFFFFSRLIFFFRPEHPIQPKPVQPLRFAILMIKPSVSGFWPIFLNFRFF